LPAVQISHVLWPVVAWVDHPAGQLVHEVSAAVVVPVGPNWPAGQAVPVHDAAPEAECVPAAQIPHALWPDAAWVDHPAGQLSHLVWPATFWNLPAVQIAQAVVGPESSSCRPVAHG